jgi:hypothetical protein
MSVPSFTGSSITPGIGEPLVIVAEGWDQRYGKTVTYEWRGNETAVRLKQTEQQGLGRRTELRVPAFETGPFILQATAGASEDQSADEPLSTTWELDANSLEKSIWDLPVVSDQFEQITDDVGGGVSKTTAIAFVRRSILAFVQGDEEIVGLSGNTFPLTYDWLFAADGALSTAGVDPDVFKEVAHLLSKGVETYPVSQFVLRKTRVVFDGTSIRPDYQHVLKPMTLATLRAHEEVPTTLLFALDGMPRQGDTTIAEGIWLKQTPTVQQTGSDKWTITEEWWHADRAEPFIYGNPV